MAGCGAHAAEAISGPVESVGTPSETWANFARMSEIGELVDRQCGMVSRRQLTFHGVHWKDIDNHVRAGRCVARTPRVLSMFTGELTVEQRRWMAVLHAGPRSLLGGLTSGEHLGMKRWERESITVLVDDELAFEPVEGIQFFRSRRSFELLRADREGIPCCQLEPALLMWAAYDAAPRAAHAVLASAVQQRLTTAPRLLQWIDLLKPLRRAPAFRATLVDVDGGSHSGAELDVARLCRQFRLRAPDRQRGRFDRSGRRRWTDCEWDLPDGTVLVLEVDGGFHMDVEHWGADLKRSRRLTRRDRLVVRCTSFELRHEPGEVVGDLIALGVPAACA